MRPPPAVSVPAAFVQPDCTEEAAPSTKRSLESRNYSGCTTEEPDSSGCKFHRSGQPPEAYWQGTPGFSDTLRTMEERRLACRDEEIVTIFKLFPRLINILEYSSFFFQTVLKLFKIPKALTCVQWRFAFAPHVFFGIICSSCCGRGSKRLQKA